ncbi:MAG: glycerate kinase [Bacteroidota bacterium]
MRILIAPDGFKDALPALDVAKAMAAGLRKQHPLAQYRLFPMGDGGEGTSDVLIHHQNGQRIECTVDDPLGRPVQAFYGLSQDGQTAYVEMAQASGLQRLQQNERNPLYTSTHGTGQLLLDAIRRGARHLILCIGGSATNDMGTGMAAALGHRFADEEGRVIPHPVGEDLGRIAWLDKEQLSFDPSLVRTTVLCDVDNPLYGPQGAAHVYAAQKGADTAAIDLLDAGMRHLAGRLEVQWGCDVAEHPGAGAAGGLGAGCLAFLNAELRSGIEVVMAQSRFDEALAWADVVLTGEGRIDGQSLRGKLIHGICQRAVQHRVPVVALCGRLDATDEQIRLIGLQAAHAISPRSLPLAEALAATRDNLEKAAATLVKIPGF